MAISAIRKAPLAGLLMLGCSALALPAHAGWFDFDSKPAAKTDTKTDAKIVRDFAHFQLLPASHMCWIKPWKAGVYLPHSSICLGDISGNRRYKHYNEFDGIGGGKPCHGFFQRG